MVDFFLFSSIFGNILDSVPSYTKNDSDSENNFKIKIKNNSPKNHCGYATGYVRVHLRSVYYAYDGVYSKSCARVGQIDFPTRRDGRVTCAHVCDRRWLTG